jgi:hypothetical protein
MTAVLLLGWGIGCTRTPFVLGLAACGSPEPAVTETPPPPPVGWVTEVTDHPDAVRALLETDRPGWVALHANDLPAAVVAFGATPVGRGRSALALGVLYADLTRVAGLANEQLFATWDARKDGAGLPAGPELPLVAALAAHCSGGTTAASWASRVTDGPDLAVAKALAAGTDPFAAESAGPFGARLAVHRVARASGDPEPVRAAALDPMGSREESGFVRRFWDPCATATLSQVWLAKARADLGGGYEALGAPTADLGSRLFAPWPTTADVAAEIGPQAHPERFGANDASLRAAGVLTRARVAVDDAEAAKDEVRELDGAIGAAMSWLDTHPGEGATIAEELRLFHRFRQEWLVVRARGALADGHARRALTYLELARDHAARAIGPENAPAVFALIAEARLRLGHTREALDALHALSAAYPETVGIGEIAGDLAVVQGLDRHGDSKED